MSEKPGSHQAALEAASPFEMRIKLGENLPETDVRSALASGDMGFLHSDTTGSAVDGPGMRVVAWTSGCMWRCRYCHNQARPVRPPQGLSPSVVDDACERVVGVLRPQRHWAISGMSSPCSLMYSLCFRRMSLIACLK